MKTLKRFYTFDTGCVIYCTTDNRSQSTMRNDPIVDVKPIRVNLIDAIRSVDPEFYNIDIKRYSKDDLMQIAENLNLLFEK